MNHTYPTEGALVMIKVVQMMQVYVARIRSLWEQENLLVTSIFSDCFEKPVPAPIPLYPPTARSLKLWIVS